MPPLPMFLKKRVNMGVIRTSSKAALKLSCYEAVGCDVEAAERLYNYMAEGLQDLPDNDPAPVSTLDAVKGGVQDVFGWLSTHREELQQGVALLQSLRGKSAAPMNLPEIPKI